MDPVIVLCILFQTLESLPTPLKAPTLFALEAAFPECGVAQLFSHSEALYTVRSAVVALLFRVAGTLLLPAEIY